MGCGPVASVSCRPSEKPPGGSGSERAQTELGPLPAFSRRFSSAHCAWLFTDHAHVFQWPIHPLADGAVLRVHGPHLQRLLFKVGQPVWLRVERVRHVQLQSRSGGAQEDGALEVSVCHPAGFSAGRAFLRDSSVLLSVSLLTPLSVTVTPSSGTAGFCSWTQVFLECSKALILLASIP